MIEPVDPVVEPTPISQQLQVLEAHAIDKGKGEYIPTLKKKPTPSKKLKGIVIGGPATPPTLISEEEDAILRGNDIISPSSGEPLEEMTKEDNWL